MNAAHLATRKSVLWKRSVDAVVEEFLDKPAREDLPHSVRKMGAKKKSDLVGTWFISKLSKSLCSF